MEVGEKIVCINNISIFYTLYQLTVNKTYIIQRIAHGMYDINNDINNLSNYPSYIFISLVEDRRNKILKLKERICVK